MSLSEDVVRPEARASSWVLLRRRAVGAGIRAHAAAASATAPSRSSWTGWVRPGVASARCWRSALSWCWWVSSLLLGSRGISRTSVCRPDVPAPAETEASSIRAAWRAGAARAPVSRWRPSPEVRQPERDRRRLPGARCAVRVSLFAARGSACRSPSPASRGPRSGVAPVNPPLAAPETLLGAAHLFPEPTRTASWLAPARAFFLAQDRHRGFDDETSDPSGLVGLNAWSVSARFQAPAKLWSFDPRSRAAESSSICPSLAVRLSVTWYSIPVFDMGERHGTARRCRPNGGERSK